MSISHHIATVSVHHYRQDEGVHLSPDAPDYELDTGYWCAKDGTKIDPFEAFDLSPQQTIQPEQIHSTPPAKTLREIYQISITSAGNCADALYTSAIDWTIEESGQEYFIEPFAKHLILLVEEFLRLIPKPKTDYKGGRHAHILTLWQHWGGYDYWGEYDENFTLIGLLEPCETGTRLTSIESLIQSQRLSQPPPSPQDPPQGSPPFEKQN